MTTSSWPTWGDRPLGTQLQAVRLLADERPVVLDDELTQSREVLLACLAKSVPFRNRIVHDNVMKLRDRSDQEALFGHPAWGGGTTPQIRSSLATFAHLESPFWAVAAGLNGVGLNLGLLRGGGDPEYDPPDDDPRGGGAASGGGGHGAARSPLGAGTASGVALGRCEWDARTSAKSAQCLPRRAVIAEHRLQIDRSKVPITLAGSLPAEPQGTAHNCPALPLCEETADLVFDFTL
jgi:hypothetical protein